MLKLPLPLCPLSSAFSFTLLPPSCGRPLWMTPMAVDRRILAPHHYYEVTTLWHFIYIKVYITPAAAAVPENISGFLVISGWLLELSCSHLSLYNCLQQLHIRELKSLVSHPEILCRMTFCCNHPNLPRQSLVYGCDMASVGAKDKLSIIGASLH